MLGTMLLSATFASRPNRFIVHATLPGGREVRCHLADPGRLVELLLPGAALRLRRAPAGSKRATEYSVALVRAPGPGGCWVSVEAVRANELAATLLAAGQVHGVPRRARIRREVSCGSSRFDFRIDPQPEGKARPMWIEVKSVTLVDKGVARFPDAPTARGRRHVEELVERVADGDRAMVLFVAQRGDARRVTPHAAIDPAFAAALANARRRGVLLRAAAFELDDDGQATHLGARPVRVDGLQSSALRL